METTTYTTTSSRRTPVRQAAVNTLAVVGFIVLIVLGMALAIYAATFVPKALNGVGSAAVYLSSIFVPSEKSDLEVVPAGTEVPFGEVPGAGIAATSTTTTATTTTVTTTTAPATPTKGPATYNVYPAGTGATVAPLSGLSDLTVTIVSTGYLTSVDTASFVKASTVPSGQRGAVKFVIKNVGTNASGRFDFEATLPTSSSYTFTSDFQASLLPGETIEYVLGFDRARSGEDRAIKIIVDEDNDVKESNENNNSANTTVDIK